MKKIYTCPMHPEIQETTPGKCPKCGGMELIEQGSETSPVANPNTNDASYTPLIVIIGIILVSAVVVSFRSGIGFSFTHFIEAFMIGFFITFAAFKLMDLKGFAEGYATYDLLAKRWVAYGYIYPFIELFFGLAMLAGFMSSGLLLAEILVMGFSGIGVAIKIVKKEKFQCACLGTFLKVPLTKVTLIEDFGMAALALLMLLFF